MFPSMDTTPRKGAAIYVLQVRRTNSTGDQFKNPLIRISCDSTDGVIKPMDNNRIRTYPICGSPPGQLPTDMGKGTEPD